MKLIWKLGMTKAGGGRGIHAFDEAKGPGSRSACRGSILWEGEPLHPKAPRCAACECRAEEILRLGLDRIPGNIAGYVRSMRLAEARRGYWTVWTHVARINQAGEDGWRHAFSGPQAEAEKKYLDLVQRKKKPRTRGAVQLCNPDDKVEREFIKSPWLKSVSQEARVADGQHP